jgi:hypothetical protein
MRTDLPNILIDNVLNEDDIKEIFNELSLLDSPYVNQDLSYKSWGIKLSEDILVKIKSYAEKIAEQELVLLEYNFVRYEKVLSSSGKIISTPLLYPHTDEGFNESRLTLDYQIRSNTSWDICVNANDVETCHTLKDNQALVFSGTHQVHWRPKKTFKENDFIELMFFNFSPIKKSVLTNSHINSMRLKSKEIYEVWKMSPGITSNVKNFYNERYKEIKDE